MRIGAKLPNTGEHAFRPGVGSIAAALEAAGFDSVWTSDHVVLPRDMASPYPFAADGKPSWPMDAPYLEPMVALSAVAATTERMEIGTAVMVLPMRNPVLFAKQAACVEAMAPGRLVLGVGVGWLREEFEALGADFDNRGEVLEEWLALARACWSGTPPAFEGRHYRLAGGFYCLPAPQFQPPVLLGGMSPVAIRRAGRLGLGWIAQQSLVTLSELEIAAGIELMHQSAHDARRALPEDGPPRVVLRVTGSQGGEQVLATRLASLASAGVTDVVVDVDWAEAGRPAAVMETLRNAAAASPA